VQQPTIRTDRLVLRPFSPSDAADIQRLAGDAVVADMTLTVPHPYENGMAEVFIKTVNDGWARGSVVAFAIEQVGVGLVGAIGLELLSKHRRGEMGYWVGRPYWNQGVATEAGRALLAFGFDALHLNRIDALVFPRNPASARVLEKLGMRHEGLHREFVQKDGRSEDVHRYALLAADWRARGAT
jgi:RimJ/RimL family protein N-acetyltransferase